MDLNDKEKRESVRLLNSFAYAIFGIRTAVHEERNLRIHLAFSVLVLLCAFIFSLSAVEWLFVILGIGGMFALELVNTAIERTIDLVTQEYHPLAKQAKDLAAGAVLIYAIVSVLIGIIIFFPHMLRFFQQLFV